MHSIADSAQCWAKNVSLIFICECYHAGILDEDDNDVLMNMNMLDDERACRNVDNKLKKPGYKAYDEDEFEESGLVRCRFSLRCNICWGSSRIVIIFTGLHSVGWEGGG